MAVAGSILCFGEIYVTYTKPVEHGWKLLKFFTVQSNILAGITALLYIIFLLRENKTKNQIPFAVHMSRYIATIDLVITFLVVVLFLGFITDEGYFSMFVNANFFFHFAIPVVNFVSFAFFESAPKLNFKHIFGGISHLAIYSVFYLIVVLMHFHDGAVSLQYDWYAFAQRGLILAFVCVVVVLAIGFLVAYIIYKINRRKQNPQAK